MEDYVLEILENGNLMVQGIKNQVKPADRSIKKANGFKDITGARFGRLVAVKWIGSEIVEKKNNKRKSLWMCHCDCGKRRIIRSASLGSKTVSCGCFSSEKTREFNIKTKTKVSYSTFSAVWQSYKKGARDRSLAFELSKDQFLKITTSNCYYCNREPFAFRRTRTKGKTPSYIYNGIDRVDSSVGYIVGNVVPCCKFCNMAKRDLSYADFMDNIQRIYKFRFLSQEVMSASH